MRSWWGNLRKVEPNDSVSLNCFPFVGKYVDKEVSMYSTEESENLVGWGYMIILMDLQ